jgi:hypothetical protein
VDKDAVDEELTVREVGCVVPTSPGNDSVASCCQSHLGLVSAFPSVMVIFFRTSRFESVARDHACG